jgi:glycerol-3-phosphate dehydrogenase (NAD(P)+)
VRIAVAGAGSWGTALALLLAGRGHEVRLWTRRPELAAEIGRRRENRTYLPGHQLPAAVVVSDSLAVALEAADMVFVAVPIQHVRRSLAGAASLVPPGTLRVGAAKGIERVSLLRLSQILVDVWGPGRYAVLSGPSFASEVARGEPTAVTVAATDAADSMAVQREVSNESFRVYTSPDVVGVEMGGALKNVIAIAAGMVRGLGFGSNSIAALLTRGLAEVRRLGVAMGGRPETFLGLAGMGDLVLTGTGALSRNVRVGEAVARGTRIEDVLGDSRMVAEGIDTALSARDLAATLGVDMPITREVVEVLHCGREPRLAMRNLMSRDLKAEEGF